MLVHGSQNSNADMTPVNIVRAIYYAIGIVMYSVVLKSYLASEKSTKKPEEKSVNPDEVQKLVTLLEQVKQTQESN